LCVSMNNVCPSLSSSSSSLEKDTETRWHVPRAPSIAGPSKAARHQPSLLQAHSSQRWLEREQRSTICRSHHPLHLKKERLFLPAIMAVAMSFVMTTVRLGFAPNLVSAWLTSFAIGVIVAIPTAILVAPRAQRLVGHLTGVPPR